MFRCVSHVQRLHKKRADSESLLKNGVVPMFRPYLPVLLFFLVTGLGFYADLATKHRAFAALGMPGEYRHDEAPEQHAVYWLWGNTCGFQTSLNEGALFGMGQGRSSFFAALSLVALLGIVGWVCRAARTSLFLVVTLGLISAGILGNLYDRLGWPGLHWNYETELHDIGEPVYAVRDWILVMIGSWPWPNFNIADAMLVCGAVLLVLHSFWSEPSTLPRPDENQLQSSDDATEKNADAPRNS